MERFVYRPVPYYKTCRMLKNTREDNRDRSENNS